MVRGSVLLVLVQAQMEILGQTEKERNSVKENWRARAVDQIYMTLKFAPEARGCQLCSLSVLP